ncbi:MAG: hypothetical protein US11_C0004G0045 [Candidatus Roizmanbacteria bacterium GW2011_GWA2_36_23]|uniref:Glycosyltransferase RgtA/B/C/D-like domain-containing protein n=1 Tax=Candidatus Roizmanbacteria bacterium GW2011_GWA2_36_23 TaxID=1618480 RepID=A0A0G0EKY1_9BACT|nr:MAG: hypothetical protein US11_C0004G0045 [Candidatus Roizmanbacteria bacterium GW2011_GWA2_36_23]
MKKINRVILIVFIALLLYSRFAGLNWGLPYPMHPDERNMAVAVQGLGCNVSNFRECFNPHFYSYGQFPLYLAYLGIQIYHFLFNIKLAVTFEEAVLSLRIISATASVINAFFLFKILQLFRSSIPIRYAISFIVIILSPFFIQFSHFGTTESLLMLLYSIITYLSIRLILRKGDPNKIIFAGLFLCGLSIAVKMSSLIFIVMPLAAIILSGKNIGRMIIIRRILTVLLGSIFIAIIFSPHNLINFNDFFGSLNYELDVATGKYPAFYTRQFINTLPIYFQLEKVFPYALGKLVFGFFLCGFLFLPQKEKSYFMLRLAILVYFLSTAFLYAKWTRFMAPIFPLMLIICILLLFRIYDRLHKYNKFPSFLFNFAFYLFILALVAPGIGHLSIYLAPDVRFQASKWIYKNIPDKSSILSETANVVDIPLTDLTEQQQHLYQIISFDFYNLDKEIYLQQELSFYLSKVDYIFVPSRRIFKNTTCWVKDNLKKIDSRCVFLQKQYPQLNNYYNNLFSGKSYTKVAEFTSYPKIEFFGYKLFEFPDENAEETWTVFDHPVIRIYKKNP